MEFLCGPYAVSYTHLDVYKRQQEVIGLWPTLIPRDALKLTTHILEVE